MLRDDGPPVSLETIHDARVSLAVDYGHMTVTERGRRVLIVRSPRAQPDYLNELSEVALYVSLDEVRELKDVVLVGSEKSCRLEPIRLRDCVREQLAEDAATVDDARRRLRREFGVSILEAPRFPGRKALAVRFPRRSLADVTAEDVLAAREALRPLLDSKARDFRLGYLVADEDHERFGRRTFIEFADPDAAAAAQAAEAAARGVVDTAAPAAPQKAADLGAETLKAAAIASSAPAPPAEVAEARPVGALTPAHAPAPTPAPAAAPMPEPEPDAAEAELVTADDEIEVYVRKPATATPPPAPPKRAVPSIVANEPADPEPSYSDGPLPDRVSHLVEENEEFEVYVSKPKAARPPPPPPPPALTQPREPAPPGAPPAVAAPSGPVQDSGASVEPSVVARVDAVETLRAKFEDAGYELMTDVHVLGSTFEIAAHRIEGKRLLVKRLDSLDADTHETLARVTREVGADVCLVITSRVEPDARRAAWGSCVEVVAPGDVGTLPV